MTNKCCKHFVFNRNTPAKFDVEDFDASLCSHGFYGFADLDNATWTISSWDPWFDLAAEDCPPGYCNYNGFRYLILHPIGHFPRLHFHFSEFLIYLQEIYSSS